MLTASEAKRVRGWIRDKCPDQLKLPYVLWTTGVVRELIRRKLAKLPRDNQDENPGWGPERAWPEPGFAVIGHIEDLRGNVTR